MYQIQKTYNGVDPIPNDIELHTIFEMLKESAEDFLRVDSNDNVEVELDIDGLLKLLMSNSQVAQREFGFYPEYVDGKVTLHGVPEHLCGFYTILNFYSDSPIYSFEQWSIG